MKNMTRTRPMTLAFVHGALASLTLICLACPAISAGETAQAAPATTNESSPPPRRSHIQPVSEMAAAAKHSDTLGLRLSRASDVLRQQLALARGAGLVVEEVAPGSVAEKAGFKRHDVLVLLDDQMLLLPEQLAALLEAANAATAPQCTLLRAGTKVTLTLADLHGEPRSYERPSLAALPKASGPSTATSVAPTSVQPPLPIVRQTAAKPSPNPRLRAPASALALVQPDRQGRAEAATVQASANVPATSPLRTPTRTLTPADETLVRHDPDFQIKLSRGNETRLIVLDPRGRIIFNGEIDTPENRGLIPIAVRQRVEEMETSLENVTGGPAAEIGSLDVPPIEIR